jgi:hypothetical protein
MVLLVAACGEPDPSASTAGSDDDAGEATGLTTAEDTTAEATDAPPDDGGDPQTSTDEADDATAHDPSAPISVDSVYDPDAEPNVAWFSAFEPGTYRTGALGTPMSFTTTEPLNTQPNGGGIFVLSDIASRAPDDRDLVFIRVGTFADPTAPNAPIEEQAGWPADDFRGWLSELHDGVLATDPVETSVNGFDAIRVDLELSDDIECGYARGFCVGFVNNNGHEIKALNKGAKYRVWVVDQGNEDPLAIVSGIALEEDASWYQRSTAVMETLSFGDVAPNPVQPLAAGPNQLDALGGVEVTVPDDQLLIHVWNGRGYAFIPITDQPAQIDFSDRPHDADGNPLGSADELIALLSAAGVELTELDATTIDGVDARVFDLTNADVGAILFRFSRLDVAGDYLGWDAPAAGRLWLIEHPDRGLMMINAKAFDNVDELLPVVTALGEALVESLIFTP